MPASWAQIGGINKLMLGIYDKWTKNVKFYKKKVLKGNRN